MISMYFAHIFALRLCSCTGDYSMDKNEASCGQWPANLKPKIFPTSKWFALFEAFVVGDYIKRRHVKIRERLNSNQNNWILSDSKKNSRWSFFYKRCHVRSPQDDRQDFWINWSLLVLITQIRDMKMRMTGLVSSLFRSIIIFCAFPRHESVFFEPY